ncbi:MAG: hypothetical protein M0C28_41580 [Candidatus Moduliflexus flocculans]|nr:hypothetical protein [Candidatus Moduliflexus flocculans]
MAALVKLLALRGSDKGPAPFRVWLEASGRGAEYTPEFTLDDVIRSLPAWTTTSVFEERALLRIPPVDPADMKRRYQARFLERVAGPPRRAGTEVFHRFLGGPRLDRLGGTGRHRGFRRRGPGRTPDPLPGREGRGRGLPLDEGQRHRAGSPPHGGPPRPESRGGGLAVGLAREMVKESGAG